MFQSVLEQQEWRARRLGAGAGVSLMVHAGIFAAALVLSAGVKQEVEKEIEVKVFRVLPPRGTPTPPATQQAVTETPTPKRDKNQTAPRNIPTKPPSDTPPAPSPQAPPDLPVHPEADPEGIGAAIPCLQCIIDKNATNTVAEPVGEEVVPFVSGNMTPPRLLSGDSLQYTREALAAHVEGLLIARCVITREGDVENCRILKGLPHMNAAVISSLETRRYTPVTYDGRPISVIYNFHVKLDLPR